MLSNCNCTMSEATREPLVYNDSSFIQQDGLILLLTCSSVVNDSLF